MERLSSLGVPLACLLVGGCSTSKTGEGSVDSGFPLRVPLTVTEVATDGSKRFSIPIEVGGSALDVLLDTGSNGLVLLEGAIPDAAYASVTSEPVTYVYGGGLQLTGVYAYATVTIGGVATPAPIAVMRATGVGCAASNPSCPGKGESASTATLFGPYRAILGAGMQNSGTFGNPIVQLPGHPAFIVEAPGYAGDAGTLRIGPTSEEQVGFATFQLPGDDGGLLANGSPSWDYGQGLPGCVHDMTSTTDYCEPVFLDCGACPTVIEWQAVEPMSYVFSPGSELAVTIGPANAPLAQYSFTVGSVPVPGIDQVEYVSQPTTGHINVGTGVYFRYNVLWDPFHGVIGLAPH